jgi:hypothetical protein
MTSRAPADLLPHRPGGSWLPATPSGKTMPAAALAATESWAVEWQHRGALRRIERQKWLAQVA